MRAWPCNDSPIEGLKGEHCVFGTPWQDAEHRVLLWGDSHAGHFAPLLDHVIDPRATSVLLFESCAPFLDDVNVRRWFYASDAYSRKCGEEHATLVQWLLEDAGVTAIVMAAAWSGYPESLFVGDPRTRNDRDGQRLLAQGLDATLARLPADIQVHILTDVPRPRRLLTYCIMGQGGIVLRKPPDDCDGLDRDDVDAWHEPTTTALERVASAYGHVWAHDSVDAFCSENTCDTFLEGRLLYRDENHLRRNLTERELSILVDRLRIRPVVASIEAEGERGAIEGLLRPIATHDILGLEDE
jgi:hypothetical protein